MNKLNCFYLVFFLWGCTIQPDPNLLTITLAGDPKSLDPAHAVDVRSGQVNAFMYDNLVRFDSGSGILPGLAESWEISEDGTVYSFQLRDSVFFQDGGILTSNHVKESFERILNSGTGSRNTWIFRDVVGADSYKSSNANDVAGFLVPSNKKFQIELTRPFAPFLGFLAMPTAAIVKVENDQIIGTGPWQLSEWVRDGHMLFSANAEYFDSKPNLDRLKIRILPEALPRVAEFITGYLDIMEIPNSEYDLWVNDQEWKTHIHHIRQLNSYYIGMNCSRPPFDDIRVRQAVNYAVNVQLILETVFSGRGQEAGGPVPPILLEREENPFYGFDPIKAKDLLIKAGYEYGFSVELWQSQSRELFQITEIIQEQLQQVGIDVKIVRNDWNMYSDAVRKGIPDMYYRSWWADYPDAENFLAPLFESGVSRTRWTRYENQKLDSLITLLQTETNHQKRIQTAQECNDILQREAPWLYLWHMESAVVTQPNLKNWKSSVMFNAEKLNSVWK